ncbi:MAG: sigma-54 dependent transcriptional regulator [Lentisphaeria bacterium]|nr:sigma-54 dependent transcriptional regulator [Lentisphaeria bacterium]
MPLPMPMPMPMHETETILMSSGFLPASLAAVRQRWQVIDIPCQREAAAHLRGMVSPPLVVCIGRVDSRGRGADLDVWEMLREVKAAAPGVPVLISTGVNSPKHIVELVKAGAFDYVLEPQCRTDQQEIDRYTEDLLLALRRAVEWRRLSMENLSLKQGLLSEDLPVPLRGVSRAMGQVMELARKVAPTAATVLITGESGTGKELVAHAIHALSPRAREPFTALNCGSFSEQLIGSELLGHARGAFTGAVMARAGLIREAGEGTLFLDEVATIGTNFQVVLLRVLEQHTARPVGAGAEYPVRCRFVAAANRDLGRMVAAGQFREDLFYRLNMFNIHLPPLRERREDIPVLTNFFLLQASQEYGKKVHGISAEALRRLEEASWPGNVRQLRNAVERAVILAEDHVLDLRDFAWTDRSGPGRPGEVEDDSRSVGPGPGSAAGFDQAMADYERRLLAEAMRDAGGNTSEAARRLGIKRPRLCYRLKLLGLA